jgi:hypothetical protein
MFSITYWLLTPSVVKVGLVTRLNIQNAGMMRATHIHCGRGKISMGARRKGRMTASHPARADNLRLRIRRGAVASVLPPITPISDWFWLIFSLKEEFSGFFGQN